MSAGGSRVSAATPDGTEQARREFAKVALLQRPALLMPILILLGLRFGFATPTEVAVLSVVYSLALSASSLP